jgi:DNA-binding IclR family transcriptional regulator
VVAAFNPEFAQTVLSAGLHRWTRYTVVDPQRLVAIIAEARRLGYAYSEDELEEGIASVAAPVMAGDGQSRRAIAAVSVVGPTERLRREGVAEVAVHVRRAAEQLGKRLTAVPGSAARP